LANALEAMEKLEMTISVLHSNQLNTQNMDESTFSLLTKVNLKANQLQSHTLSLMLAKMQNKIFGHESSQ